MTDVNTCVEQRQRETEKTRKLVTIGVIASIAFHGFALSMVSNIEKPLTKEENKPIELIIVQEPELEIKPEKPKPKPKEKHQSKPKAKLKEVEAVKPKPQPNEVVKSNPSPPKSKPTEVVKSNPLPPKSEITEPVKPPTPIQEEVKPEEITQPLKTPTSITTESNPVKPEFNTPTPTPNVENIAPIQPQEVFTNNTLARNNIPRAVNPITNDDSSNSLSNSFKSSPRVTNTSNSNSETSVPRISDDVGVSSGRMSRSNSKTPSAVTNTNGGERENISSLRNSLSRSNGNSNNGNGKSQVSSISSNIAPTSQSIPQRPKPKPTPPESIKCISNCNPIYPSELQGAEGKATVKVNLDDSGNVLGVSVINPHSNPELNRQALLAARQMRFSSPSINNASVPVSINFTVAGSEFDRIARQKKEEQQRLARLALDKERQARQAQLEKERLQRQQQLEKERQERERLAQIEREKREQQLREIPPQVTPSTNLNNNENQPSLELEEKPEATLEGSN